MVTAREHIMLIRMLNGDDDSPALFFATGTTGSKR